MDINGGFNDILEEGKRFFFPSGVSSQGHESDFTFDGRDLATGKMYDTVQLPT